MHTKENTSSLVFRMASVLLCLVLLTTHLMSGMMARYATSASGSDGATVASYNVSITKTSTWDVEFNNLIPGNDATWTFTVTSDSETAIAVKAKLEGTENLPLNYSIGGKALSVNGAFVTIDEISDGSSTKAYELTATWKTGISYSDYYDQIDALKLTIRAEQID